MIGKNSTYLHLSIYLPTYIRHQTSTTNFNPNPKSRTLNINLQMSWERWQLHQQKIRSPYLPTKQDRPMTIIEPTYRNSAVLSCAWQSSHYGNNSLCGIFAASNLTGTAPSVIVMSTTQLSFSLIQSKLLGGSTTTNAPPGPEIQKYDISTRCIDTERCPHRWNIITFWHFPHNNTTILTPSSALISIPNIIFAYMSSFRYLCDSRMILLLRVCSQLLDTAE